MDKYEKRMCKIALIPVIFSIFALTGGAGSLQSEGLPMKNIEYGEHTRQKMDISLPEIADEQHKVPIVLCIHGGSWTNGDKTNFDYIIEKVHKINSAYVSVNYRLLGDSVTHKEMLDDIYSAVAFLKKNGDKYHLKTDKMFVIGSSAGGHLALLYSYTKESPIKVAFLSSRTGPADFLDPDQQAMNGVNRREMLNKLTGTNVTLAQATDPNFIFPQEWYDASPIYQVNSASPPTILAYGMQDELVSYSNATRMDAKLTEKGVTHKLITFPNSGHSLSNDPDRNNEYWQVVYQYFNEYMLK
ncbi:hypothetical protein FACS1894201_00900 [Bacteroidia bacterium]|nr:hypothetical protein FACS1894201_00900 [Bacteroidia bacterium]